MARIKAAVTRAFNAPFTIEEVELAEPRTGEVEVTLGAVAICHSDISYAEGAWGGKLPAIFGHEAAGTITKMGQGVAGFAEGDRAVDMSPEKLDMAREFGATDGVLATEEKPWRSAKKAMGRAADAAIVTVGAIPAYDQAPRYLSPGGKVIMVGMPHTGHLSSYEPGILAALGQGMVGSKMGDVVIQRDIPWLVDLYEQGRLKLDDLISGRWRLDQINEAVADTKTGAARRNVIVFD